MHDGDAPRDRPGGSAGPRMGQSAPGTGGTSAEQPAVDLQSLASDWIALWQSELTAAAADRELQETWQTLAALWAGVAEAMLQGIPRGSPDGARRSTGAWPFAPPWTAPAAAASDARDAEVDRLARRVAELERRLAELDGGAVPHSPNETEI